MFRKSGQLRDNYKKQDTARANMGNTDLY